MKNLKRIRWAGALTLAPALLAWACGDAGNGVSGPTPPSSSAPANVAGSWIGTWRIEAEQDQASGLSLMRGGTVRLSLLQYGTAVTGAAEFTGVLGGRATADCFEQASVAGRVAGDQISLRLTNGTPALEGRLEGRLHAGSLNGNYADACIPSAMLTLTRE